MCADNAELDLTTYSPLRLRQELSQQLPRLVRGLPQLLAGLVGPAALPLEARVALQLRLGQLLGCPVCLKLFPRVARRAGMDEAEIAAARQGVLEQLPRLSAAAVSWGEALLRAPDGQPELVPGAAITLTSEQRAHMAQFVRMERVVHSAGLLMLPHRLIERALAQ